MQVSTPETVYWPFLLNDMVLLKISTRTDRLGKTAVR